MLSKGSASVRLKNAPCAEVLLQVSRAGPYGMMHLMYLLSEDTGGVLCKDTSTTDLEEPIVVDKMFACAAGAGYKDMIRCRTGKFFKLGWKHEVQSSCLGWKHEVQSSCLGRQFERTSSLHLATGLVCTPGLGFTKAYPQSAKERCRACEACLSRFKPSYRGNPVCFDHVLSPSSAFWDCAACNFPSFLCHQRQAAGMYQGMQYC
jgi:hypothetical protein